MKQPQHLTPEQEMWVLRAMMPPPHPFEVWVASWELSRGRHWLMRVRLMFSAAWTKRVLEELVPPLGPPPGL